jgi:hypothetical protein
MSKMKGKLVALAIVAVTFGSVGGVGHATTAPGQCKKQGPSDCNGKSECAGPHFDLLPLGQKKKC